jgi:hypothetical protein
MTFESDRRRLNLALRIFLMFAKAGKLGLLLEILIGAFKAKLSFDEAMGRANGKFYEWQSNQMVERYKRDHPRDFEVDIKVDGYDKWNETNPEK